VKPRKFAYVAHRWLGLIVCVQLLAWSTGGLIFSVLAIDSVRGERDSTGSPPRALTVPMDGGVGGVEDVEVGTMTLIDRGLGPVWEIRDVDGKRIARLDTTSGQRLPLITEDEAREIALGDFTPDATVGSVRLIESDAPGEFRGGPLPAYEVRLDHAKHPHYYISAITGEVLAKRNDSWRVFDFFWMLHIMDYDDRDNFNHILLTGFSALAVLTAGSGIALWSWRAGTWVGRKRRRGAAGA